MGKKANRIWSVILVIVMLINTLPLGVLAEEYQENAASKTTAANAQPGTDDAYIISEVTENRTEFTKEFVLSNGLHMATVYPQAVHYEEDGQWHEINNTLQISGTDTDAAYTNTAGIWEVKLPQQLTDERGVSITKDGYTLSFFMSGEIRASSDAAMSAAPISLEESGAALILEEAEPVTAQVEEIDLSEAKADAEYPELISEKLQSRLTYADIYTDTDIVYDLTSNQLKESIVIGQYSSTLRGYMYTLDVGSLTPVLAQSGKIELYDETGSNLIMVMPAPYLIDNAGEYCGEVTVELQRKGDSYLLAYLLPQEWLADENRQWPVVLDPVVSATANFSNIKDQNVYSAAWADPEAGVLQCGYSASLGKMRFYVQYVEIPKLTSADVVVSAMAQLYKPYGSGTTASVEVHKVTETWDSMTMQWSNMADYDETIEDFAISKEAGFYRWDVTDIVRGWYEGENTGMMFKNPESVENGGTNSWKQFTSSDYNMYDNTTKPTLIILFRNNNGLESYWDYTSSSAGRAGTGYINNYTGNLVWIRSDIGFGGNRMPVSISHIYNANDSAYNTFGLGKGWRTNFNQRVQQWEMDPNYYVWEDSDGTSHYFPKESSGIYKDEDGLELTLKITNSSTEKYTIADKYGNTSYFDYEGRLIKQENNQQSKSSINITYTSASGYLISKITDGAGRVYNFTYSGDLLSEISYVGSGTNEPSYVTFEYSGSKLTTIKDKDGEVSTFTYKDNSADTSKNLIASVTDVDGYKLTYEYSTSEEGKPARVISVKEEDGEADGGTLTIEYAKNQTTFTDYSGNVQIMQFNNFGNTISIQDDQGRAHYNQ